MVVEEGRVSLVIPWLVSVTMMVFPCCSGIWIATGFSGSFFSTSVGVLTGLTREIGTLVLAKLDPALCCCCCCGIT